MSIREVAATLAQIPTLLRVARELKVRPPETRDSLAARLERTSREFGDRRAIIFEDKTLTWAELNRLSNRYARALQSAGVERGDSVSVLLENRVELLACILALNKLGAIASLINNNLTGRSLVHCMRITESRRCIFGEETLAAVAEVRNSDELSAMDNYLFVADSGQSPCPEWAANLDELAADCAADNPPQSSDITLGETALYVFTSGTTGFPKAAVISNRRFLAISTMSHLGGMKCTADDCIYLCLPLYHGTGLFLGVGAALSSGACMFVRRRFSASNFLPEVRAHGVTCFIYIGELCRYLLNAPPGQGDADNPLRTAMGNGLRPDIWKTFKSRFGLARVAEFYGSSEGNIGFVNLLNKDCTVGLTTQPIALVAYDIDADEIRRDPSGRCVKVAAGEPGLLLGKITDETIFEGYTSSEETEKKILRGVFEEDDAWFNTGDLMRSVPVGFSLGLTHYQFVDRVGDTFRWMSENVSTNELGEIINGHPQVDFCNVYGVEIPGTNGRAGMAAIVLAEGAGDLDLESFSRYVRERLPTYARPVFLRIRREIDTTGTFKMVKGDLRREGYDPSQVTDPLYVLKPRADSYEPLDAEFVQRLRSGTAGY